MTAGRTALVRRVASGPTLAPVVPDDDPEERGRIRAVDAHLTARYDVVVDDVVLRTWGNEQVELTYLLLSAAITASGAEIEEADLWAVARAVAFRTAVDRPRLAG